ncbi:hypothetical protein BGZ61DRAFT_29480 [Ilyonectria robusta]|uniref:uncharacterized protein n=1 Tax=Ilyonectria robusta TaxID=1079257 RepID=UPI001E8E5463|nr:uncharacterized protein BGZ61DRAFT_29480 [Ilyonectria robusta]KAH8738216.1 hypothetical protein BGZ61DRAFT_29480 [Ilyonectria robusta]
MAESAGSIMTGNGAAHINGKSNGQPLGRRRTSRKRRSPLLWTFNVVARLATWAAILTILFRCPSSPETCDESSPFICRPYFQVKNAVSPHLQPYYDEFAAPYVEIARPYYETVHERAWKPTRAYAIQYGAPWVEKAQEHAWAQWQKNGQPQLAKYQGIAQEKYDESVAPYVSQATYTVGPYYDIARTNALQVYYEYVLPGYEFVHPYMIKGYDAASDFTTSTALPTAYWAWNKSYVFLDAKVWPHLRVVYNENVEPQLVRIGERLGRFNARDKVKTSQASQEKVPSSSVTDSVPSSFIKPAPQSTASPETTSQQPVASESLKTKEVPEPSPEPNSDLEAEDVAGQYVNPVQAPPADENETEGRRKAREMVAQDLETWQNKFATQADDGAADMEDRVDEIADRMIEQNAKVTGRALFDELESTIDLELRELKSKISSLVEVADERPDSVQGQVLDAVRSAGVAIKTRALAIRQWRESYDKELQNTVIAVADVHFQILDETRNLALQHIGMRWAWTEGVTYKDWAKYHELKATLNEWTEQLKQLIVTHPALLEAQDASAQVEDEGMEIASAAARELARLKEVARWKISAGDATDNFDSEEMKMAAEAATLAATVAAAEKEQAATEAVVEDISDTEFSYAESVFDEKDTASIDTSSTDDDAAPTTAAREPELRFEEFDSLVGEPIEEATSSIPEADQDDSADDAETVTISLADGTETETISLAGASEPSDNIDKTSLVATDTIEEISTEASSLMDEAKETLSSIADQILETAEDLPIAEPESIASVVEELSSEISEASSSPDATDATDAAEHEDATLTDYLVSEASEALVGDGTYTIASNESEEPASVDGEDESSHTDIDEDVLRDETPISEEKPVKRVMFGAAAQEVPNRQIVLEDYEDDDVVGKATGAAQAAYSSAVSRASEQYSSALSVVSAQIYGTPKPVHGQLLSSVSNAYQSAVSAASEKFNNAVEGIKGTPATPTTTPTFVDWQNVEAIAAQRLNEGRLWAEVQYQSALIALGLATSATPTPSTVMEKYYEQAKFNYYAGLGIAQDRYYSFMAGASSALSSMTATPTPTSTPTNVAESASSIASVAYESAASALSAAGNGVASAAQAVDDSVSSVVDAANEQISNAGIAIADTWGNVVAEISAQVYGEPTHTAQIAWYEHIFSDIGSYAAAATDAVTNKAHSASDSAATVAGDASKQYEAVNELVSELISGKEPSFSESVLSRLHAAYTTAAASVGSLANAASQATEAVKEKVQNIRDEL